MVDLMEKASASHSGQQPSAKQSSAAAQQPSPLSTTDHSGAATLDTDLTVDKEASPTSDCGSMKLTESRASYVNSAHWVAVLDGIAELKDHFEKEEEEAHANRQPPDPSFPDLTGPQLLYGCTKLATKEEILASIPARSVVDRLVSNYFNTFEMSPGEYASEKKNIGLGYKLTVPT